MTTALLGCGQLITLQGPSRPRVGPEMCDVGVLQNGALLFRDGLIEAVGTSSEIAERTDSKTNIIDARGRLVTPGLVDAHTHAIFAGDRANEFQMRIGGASYQDIKQAGGGILSSVRATRETPEDDLVRLANNKLHWMLRCGTTTVEVKSGYGLNLETEMKMLRAAKKLGPQRIVSTFLGAHAVPPEAASKESYLRNVIDGMLPEAAKLAEFCDIFIEEGYFDAEDARSLFDTARRLGLKPRLHVDQFIDSGGAKLAAEMQAKTADHLEQTDLEGIRALQQGGVIPVLLPASVYGLGLHRYPQARLMIDEGLPVVIATDFNPGSSPTPSLLLAMSLACTQMKMSPAEALSACTINAAYALDRGESLGSLQPGKVADFVIHDVDDYRELAYWSGRESAETVYIAGQPVYSRSRIAT